jgi:hypothetical protein
MTGRTLGISTETVHYLDFLQRAHEQLAPPTYLEIGIRHGDSLALARSTSAGIDPDYRLKVELPDEVALFRETSDEYFDRPDPLEALGGRPVAFSFIDGLHLAEFALRDFINVERHADWTSVIVFDDIFPRTVEEASRDRQTRAWTGDVYKVLEVLARHRPDLSLLRVDTEPTGLLLVLGLDPASTVLADRYDDIVAELVAPDPQDVPEAVLRREGAVDPDRVLGSCMWSLLREAREHELPAKQGLKALRRCMSGELGVGVSGGGLRRLLRRSA